MLDPKLLRSNLADVTARLARRGFVVNTDELESLEQRRKAIQVRVQELQGRRNALAKEVGRLKTSGQDASVVLQESGAVGEDLKQAEADLVLLQDELYGIALGLPNMPHASVPDGRSEENNAEVRRWGEPRRFDFAPKDHVDVGGRLGLDFDAATKITGSRFVVMSGALARLHRALIQFMLDVHTRDHGYTEVYVPYMVNTASLRGTGQLPKFEGDQFAIKGDQNYYLIPTAEVPVTNLARDEILDPATLPRKYVCHTPCFRSEAGSYGKDTRGMIRQHQFEKVELVQMVRPSDSYEALEQLTAHAEQILKRLELPYRVMALCAGDLGFSSAKTYDLEVWLPGQQRYREISSCSNFEEFQARRMQARWRNPATGKPELLHTLNGSGLAVGRTLVAILENYQDKNGVVAIPTALRSYLDGLSALRP